ncbi:hypothetical protein QBC38DRAFT_460761 [Podospora fimiseda]|uniref:Uncharacterized protein n=1 Tax=Podospora fimiseda TaxID=252190 RepID=A0AAN7BFI2_9PEZI|nr:hypothetical protein QBC38DRAFT_460761 [Podospora fimiseda]
MGIIKKTLYTTALTGTSLLAYLGAATTVLSPLPDGDPLLRSKIFNKYNVHRNASTQDIAIKRIPISQIKPELLQKEGDLALEFCRGVWGGLGYRIQRAYLANKYKNPETSSQLWTVEQLNNSKYDPKTVITDHFEVVAKTPTEIVVRCGDTPRNQAPRESDGLFVISATVDKAREEVVFGLKSCFFDSSKRVEGIQGPMPGWIEEMHRWYSRILLETGSWKVKTGFF